MSRAFKLFKWFSHFLTCLLIVLAFGVNVFVGREAFGCHIKNFTRCRDNNFMESVFNFSELLLIVVINPYIFGLYIVCVSVSLVCAIIYLFEELKKYFEKYGVDF